VDSISNQRPTQEPSVLNTIGSPQVIHHSDYAQGESRISIPTAICDPLEPLSEIYSALVVGTRDYVRKCGFQKVLLGLSGGIDSSLTAAIAVDALGKDNVLGVAMPSRYSSEGSLLDAQALANNLGMELITVPIEEAFKSMLNMLSGPFQGREPNVAEENLQTRIRGNILMGISNKFGWMVLTTGNKSEMATGYATLYGDMAGGFAVIKDVPKTLVYELSKNRNARGEPKNVIPTSVLDKVPTAELKPDQTDQDTLPPYEVLDPILQAYVEEDRSFPDIVGMGFEAETVQKVISMVNRNEYKRRQAPTGVKITQRAFGRDRRLPIVNRYKQF
jgi:NAD+ synthase (glutamine-hydrolysing)